MGHNSFLCGLARGASAFGRRMRLAVVRTISFRSLPSRFGAFVATRTTVFFRRHCLNSRGMSRRLQVRRSETCTSVIRCYVSANSGVFRAAKVRDTLREEWSAVLCSRDVGGFMRNISRRPPLLQFPRRLRRRVGNFSARISKLRGHIPAIRLGALANLGLAGKDGPLIRFVSESGRRGCVIIFTGGAIGVCSVGNGRGAIGVRSNTCLTAGAPHSGLQIVAMTSCAFMLGGAGVIRLSDGGSPSCFGGRKDVLCIHRKRCKHACRI